MLLAPGEELDLHPADWRDSYGRPLHLHITRVSLRDGCWDHGPWVWVEGRDDDDRHRGVYVRLRDN